AQTAQNLRFPSRASPCPTRTYGKGAGKSKKIAFPSAHAQIGSISFSATRQHGGLPHNRRRARGNGSLELAEIHMKRSLNNLTHTCTLSLLSGLTLTMAIPGAGLALAAQ